MDKVLQCMSVTTAPFFIDKVQAAKNTGAARRAVASDTKRTVDYNDGVAFGRLLLLLGIPERHLRQVCWSLLADWWYPENKRSAWASNVGFTQGLNEGYKEPSSDYADLTTDAHESLPNSLMELEAGQQGSSATHLGFDDFLADMERAAFGGRQNENAEVNQESSEWSVFNTVPNCFSL